MVDENKLKEDFAELEKRHYKLRKCRTQNKEEEGEKQRTLDTIPREIDMQSIVKKGYEEGNYAKEYSRQIDNFEMSMLTELFKNIKSGASILDLGCGIGIPYDKFLAQNGYCVTGIDLIKKHVELAGKTVENADFIEGDYTKENFNKKFDAIVSFYSIFNIDRRKHRKIFQKMHALLQGDGWILITLGGASNKFSVTEFIGSKMAWSSYDSKEYRKMINKAGFEIVKAIDDKRGTNHHLWILAKKKIN